MAGFGAWRNQNAPPPTAGQGWVKVGQPLKPFPGATPKAPSRGATAGQAIIPQSYYDPKWTEQLDAGKRESEHSIEGLETRNRHGEQDYGIGLSELEHNKSNALANLGTTRTRQNENATKALAALAESYKKLGVRQTEGANTAGVLQGGALLQSAMKRAGNEGIQKQGIDQTLQRQLQDDTTQEARVKEGDENAIGRLLRTREREGENINESEIPYAKESITNFEKGIKREQGREAANNGYEPIQPRRASKPATRPVTRRPHGGRQPNYFAKARKGAFR